MNEKKKNILKILKDNFVLCKKDYPINFKTKFWDVFPKNFKKIFDNETKWEQAISIPQRTFGKTTGRWPQALDKVLNKKESLISNKKVKYKLDPIRKKHLINGYNILRKQIDINHIKKFSDRGKADSTILNYKKFPLIEENIDALYHSWKINSKLRPFLKDAPFILEIGAGQGHLSIQLKRIFPKSTIIFLDLPEMSALQRWYQWKNFPKAKVFDYIEYKKNGINNLYKKKYDFAFLPGWVIKDIKNESIDLVINISSMQEMHLKIISDYMFHVNRIVKNDGFFYCSNRYRKIDSGISVNIKEYQFGNYWYLIESQRLFGKPWLHELIARKTSLPNAYPPQKVLSELDPLGFKDILLHFSKIYIILKKLIWTNDHRNYSKSLNILVKKFFLPLRSKLKIKTRLKLFKQK